jgi:hypothetical protein
LRGRPTSDSEEAGGEGGRPGMAVSPVVQNERQNRSHIIWRDYRSMIQCGMGDRGSKCRQIRPQRSDASASHRLRNLQEKFGRRFDDCNQRVRIDNCPPLQGCVGCDAPALRGFDSSRVCASALKRCGDGAVPVDPVTHSAGSRLRTACHCGAGLPGLSRPTCPFCWSAPFVFWPQAGCTTWGDDPIATSHRSTDCNGQWLPPQSSNEQGADLKTRDKVRDRAPHAGPRRRVPFSFTATNTENFL